MCNVTFFHTRIQSEDYSMDDAFASAIKIAARVAQDLEDPVIVLGMKNAQLFKDWDARISPWTQAPTSQNALPSVVGYPYFESTPRKRAQVSVGSQVVAITTLQFEQFPQGFATNDAQVVIYMPITKGDHSTFLTKHPDSTPVQ